MRQGGGFEAVLGALQSVGRSLMVPIAVLPTATLIPRLEQPDLLDIGWMVAGQAIFEPARGLRHRSDRRGGRRRARRPRRYFVFAGVFNSLAPQLEGRLASGYDADVTVLGSELSVEAVYKSGSRIYPADV